MTRGVPLVYCLGRPRHRVGSLPSALLLSVLEHEISWLKGVFLDNRASHLLSPTGYTEQVFLGPTIVSSGTGIGTFLLNSSTYCQKATLPTPHFRFKLKDLTELAGFDISCICIVLLFPNFLRLLSDGFSQ